MKAHKKKNSIILVAENEEEKQVLAILFQKLDKATVLDFHSNLNSAVLEILAE